MPEPGFNLDWPDHVTAPFRAVASAGVAPQQQAAGPDLSGWSYSLPNDPVLHERGERPRGDSGPSRVSSAVIPHEFTFSALYNIINRVQPHARRDEALRRSVDDALAMRRDPFVHELITQRKMPVAQLPFHVEPDDPEDPEQQAIASELQHLVERIPRFTFLRMALGEGIFYGRAGIQVKKIGKVRCRGRERFTVTDWFPVLGDKIGYSYDGEPTMLVSPLWTEPDGARVEISDRGRVMVLDRPEFRRQFVIHNFEPTDTDYLFEAEKQGAVHGLGLRDRLYWAWFLRQEIQSYYFDGLQKISTNGTLVGYYEAGNEESRLATIDGLKTIRRDAVAVLPREKAAKKDDAPAYDHIPTSNIAYDELREGLTHLEDEMRRLVLGQNLSSQSDSTGLGSKVAELHDDTFTRIIRYDAKALDETITRDLIPILVRANLWSYRGKRVNSLPFDLRYVSEIDRPDVKEKMEAATQFAGLGGRLDLEQLGGDLGLPLDEAGQPTAEEREAERRRQEMEKAVRAHKKRPEDKGADDGSQGPEGPVAEAPGKPGPAAEAVKAVMPPSPDRNARRLALDAVLSRSRRIA